MDLWFGDPYRDYDVIENAISFDVLPRDQFGTGLVPGPDVGVMLWPAEWTFQADATVQKR